AAGSRAAARARACRSRLCGAAPSDLARRALPGPAAALARGRGGPRPHPARVSRRILLLIPHPDDEVVGCAILSARARAQGAELFGLYLTTGLPAAERQWAGGRRRHGERVARRRSEARAAAARLGISILALNDWPSRELKAHLDAAKAQAADAIAQHGITELWTAAWEGAHQDHDAANALAAVFADRVAVAEFAEYNLMEGRVSTQRFPGAETAPGETIRLTPDERDLKRALLALYAS